LDAIIDAARERHLKIAEGGKFAFLKHGRFFTKNQKGMLP